MIPVWSVLLWGMLQAAPPRPQASLSDLMSLARNAFTTRDFGLLFDERRPVRLELPNQTAAVSVRGRVAAASLASLVRRTQDVDLTAVDSAEVAPGYGYLELLRRYRVMGTDEIQTQRVLISVKREEETWRIVEFWVGG